MFVHISDPDYDPLKIFVVHCDAEGKSIEGTGTPCPSSPSITIIFTCQTVYCGPFALTKAPLAKASSCYCSAQAKTLKVTRPCLGRL